MAVLGAGLAGMATALRLQAAGLSTVLLESHGHVGGCAGYYRHKGFSFDVGATTLVDFEAGGVGAELLDTVGIAPLRGRALPGYRAWLPDRTVDLHRDRERWHAERLRAFGDGSEYRRFWRLLDRLADTFWAASRNGARMPVRTSGDVLHNVRAVGLRNLPMAPHVLRTLGGALRSYGLRDDPALVGLLAMLVEDTVHASVDEAPLVNAALGVTIRGAGLTRHEGGMRGFWQLLVRHYRSLGGELATGRRVLDVSGGMGAFRIGTTRGAVSARQVVSALGAATSAEIISSRRVAAHLAAYLRRDSGDLGGAFIVFLGVPDDEVADQEFTHHQLMQSYTRPLGDGNNMFVSVSEPGDLASAPAGHRTVMISTHTALADWEGLDPAEYDARKSSMTDRLIDHARVAYPRLGTDPVVVQAGSPRTFAHYTRRPRGAVGGVHQKLSNSNQRALPHSLGEAGLWLVGDSTWPGLGTVACVLGSRIVADGVLDAAPAAARVGLGVGARS